jgi:hypothetical protein
MRNSLRIMYKHRNMQVGDKKQILLKYIMLLLDKYSKKDRPLSRPNTVHY